MTRAERIVEELGADAPVAARGKSLIPSAIHGTLLAVDRHGPALMP